MRILAKTGSGLSRAWNVIRYGGKWHTTTSARCYRDAILLGGKWQGRMDRIDRIFRVIDRNPNRQPHCKWAAEEKERVGLQWHDDMQRIREIQATRRNSKSV